MADKENLPPTPPNLSPITIGLRPWQVSPFASPPLRAISPNSKPALSRQRDHSACGRPETPLKVRKTRENLRDTRTYSEIPPPCSHILPHQHEEPSNHQSSTTECTLPSYHTNDVASMPPPPLSASTQPKIQRHKSVSRRMLSKVKQGINNRSKASLSIRPTESDTSLLRRLSSKRQQSSEQERRAQSFEVSRDSIISMVEDDFDNMPLDAAGGQRSCTDSTVSTGEIMADGPSTPVTIPDTALLATTSNDAFGLRRLRTMSCDASPSHTPRPLRTAVLQSVLVPCVDLTVTTDVSAVDANAEHDIWVAIHAVVRGTVHSTTNGPAVHETLNTFPSTNGHIRENTDTSGDIIGAVPSLRLCYKPVENSAVLDVVGQKAVKDLGIGESCTLFVKVRVSKLHINDASKEPDQLSLIAELESMVGTLETEVLHVEARYRSSLLPYSNVVAVREIVKVKRPKTESRWSIVGTYSDMEMSEQMYTKLAIYLADSYPPDKALKYIDRYLAKEAKQEPVQQIRQKVADDFAEQHGIPPDAGESTPSEHRPTVIVTDIDMACTTDPANAAEEFATAPCTPVSEIPPLHTHSVGLGTVALRTTSRSTSLFAMAPHEHIAISTLTPSRSTMSVVSPCIALGTGSTNDARRLWHHIRHSSLSAEQLVDITSERLEHLEAGDEKLRELRRKAIANKRSVGAETLRAWKWEGQAVKLGEAPWL
ncbi:hypothetical protein LTR97_010551 [Elasticomyces elasticus]|uniref:Uncharacterized protein n=1 Tax=Elasticomyces elasticus TaxID=574655 RepID=A0AAN7ZLK3_9PEZI|nr:hypothetical protein LTR97_010551 [Elasticomyces elasticus]